MYNSSFQSNYSVFKFNETVDWYFNCKGQYGKNVISITSVLCFIVGTPVHFWSFWVYFHGSIHPNLVFRLNITILELLFCIQCIVEFCFNSYPSRLGYYLLTFLVGLGWTFRPILQTCMGIEQYLAVIHPVTFLRYKSIHYRTGAAGAAWFIALGNSVRLILLPSYTFPDHVFFMLFCVAVTIVSFFCVSVLCALKRPGPGGQSIVEMTEKDSRNKTDRAKTSENHKKRKAFNKICRILASILTCYISLVVAYFMIMAKIDEDFCKAVPLVLSITITTISVSSLIRVYKEGHFKHTVFSNLREQIKGK